MIEFLKGKKSYLLAAALAYGLGGYFTGHFDAQTMIEMIWAALGLGALRAGISNEK
jgi:ABC-type Na+ efflux pump permease subunit